MKLTFDKNEEVNYDNIREWLLSFGPFAIPGQRMWFKITSGQLSATCPNFISEESGSLKKLIYTKNTDSHGLLLSAGGTQKVDGVLINNPWSNGEIPEEVVKAYGEYYGYENMVFDAEITELKEV